MCVNDKKKKQHQFTWLVWQTDFSFNLFQTVIQFYSKVPWWFIYIWFLHRRQKPEKCAHLPYHFGPTFKFYNLILRPRSTLPVKQPFRLVSKKRMAINGINQMLISVIFLISAPDIDFWCLLKKIFKKKFVISLFFILFFTWLVSFHYLDILQYMLLWNGCWVRSNYY